MQPFNSLDEVVAAARLWIPSVRESSIDSVGRFLQVLMIGVYAESKIYQEEDGSRACAWAGAKWLAYGDGGAWSASSIDYVHEHRAAPWVTAELSDGPANLGTFGTLPGIWNGLPAFANYTLDFGIDTLIAWCIDMGSWTVGPVTALGCGHPLRNLRGVGRAISLAGAWSITTGMSEVLGDVQVDWNDAWAGWDARVVGLFQGWKGNGWLVPKGDGSVQLIWEFDAASPWPGRYVGTVESDGLVAFPGFTFWVRPTEYANQHQRSAATREADLQCCYRKLAEGTYHTAVCGPGDGGCACAGDYILTARDAQARGFLRHPDLIDHVSVVAVVLLVVFCLAFWALGSTAPATRLTKPAPRLRGLQALRFLGSLHIAAFHLCPLVHPSKWGGPNWVSWYFMASGFGLAWQRLHDCEAEDGLPTRREYFTRLARRVVAVYPLHVLGLLVGAMSLEAPELMSWDFLRNLFLVQAWRLEPGMPPGEPWNHVNWFLSTLFAYYLLFDVAFVRVARLPKRRVPLALALCWSWSLWGEFVVRVYGLNPWNDGDVQAVWFKQFRYTHPLSFYHCFLFGAVLARWVVDGPPAFVVTGTATFGSAAFLLLVTFFGPWRAYVGIWNGFLLPLHGVVLAGLALDNRDPLRRLLDRPLAERLGGLAFPLYILHAAVYHVYRWYDGTFPPPLSFWVLLTVVVVVAHILDGRIQRFLQRFFPRKRPPLSLD